MVRNRLMFLAVAILASATSLGAQSCPSTCTEVARATVDSALKHMRTPRLNSLEASRAKMQAALDTLSRKVNALASSPTDTSIKFDILRLRSRAEYYSGEVEKLKAEGLNNDARFSSLLEMSKHQAGIDDAQNKLLEEINKRIAGWTNGSAGPHKGWSTGAKWGVTGGVIVGLVGGYFIGANNGLWGSRSGGKDVTVITNVCVGPSCR
jgi:Skp family chaperone for outer membrane proteins